MMTSRDRVVKTLNHEPVDRAPRDLWASTAIEISHGDELAEMLFRYPGDVQKPDFRYPRGERTQGIPYAVGNYTDAWGCTWKVDQRGTTGELRAPPLADPAKIAGYRPPLELLHKANFGRVNRSCAATSRFVLGWTETRPFDRLCFLHGAEATTTDLAYGSSELLELLDMLHDFSSREMEFWASSDVDGVAFRDDWGTASGLRVEPRLWRSLFKPLYREYCRTLHQHDKFVFFRSSGNIRPIFRDLVEIGVDAIHADLLSMDLEKLAERFRDKVTFWGGIDQQKILPSGSREDVAEAVRRIRQVLDQGYGGVIAQCRWDPGTPFENMAALFEEWLRYPPVQSQPSTEPRPR